MKIFFIQQISKHFAFDNRCSIRYTNFKQQIQHSVNLRWRVVNNLEKLYRFVLLKRNNEQFQYKLTIILNVDCQLDSSELIGELFCFFRFYGITQYNQRWRSVDDLNPSGGALLAIQNVVSTRIKCIPNTCEIQAMQCINRSVVWSDLFIYTHIT